MGKYSSDSDYERRSSKKHKSSSGRRRSTSSDSSDSRLKKRKDKKPDKYDCEFRHRDRYTKLGSSSRHKSHKSKYRRSVSHERSKHRRSSSRDRYRRSRSRDKHRSRRSSSRSYIREFVSKPKKRSSSSSSSSSNSSSSTENRNQNKLKVNTIGNSNIKDIHDKSNEMPIIVDNDVLEDINNDSFVQKKFSSKKVPENIVIDLKKQTIKVPDVEPVEPDSIFHHTLLSYDNSWPVPKYYGACGRFVVEENRGQPLNSKADDEWIIRAYFALQLLYAAKNFTDSHQDFRFYLTDISADNIAVDSSLKITFIDLENIVVVHKNMTDNNATHHSEVFDSENFAYSEESLCNSTISDHNYFAVCKLLLSKDAPWPMMKNGLLHSPPLAIAYKHKILFDLIEECVLPSSNDSRFVIINKVIDILQTILSEGTINELQNSTLYTL